LTTGSRQPATLRVLDVGLLSGGYG
jgi:hypothetical protein